MGRLGLARCGCHLITKLIFDELNRSDILGSGPGSCIKSVP